MSNHFSRNFKRNSSLPASHGVLDRPAHSSARPWIATFSLMAFLGLQWMPGIMTLQQAEAQGRQQSAQQRVEAAKAAAIEASRAKQALELKQAQRARVRPSQPTACPPGECETTTIALDLSRPPTEKELRMAGGMGGALTPLGSADVNRLETKSDGDLKKGGLPEGLRTRAKEGTPTERVVTRKKKRIERLRKANMTFGQAMQEWNKHNYVKAADMLEKHVEDFPESPWVGEAILHLGCDAKYNGRFAEAAEIYDGLIKKTEAAAEGANKNDKGENAVGGGETAALAALTNDDDASTPAEVKAGVTDIHQKAKLRWADLNIVTGQIDEATDQLRDIIKTDKDWRRRTWAMHWLRMMGTYKANARTLRACGTKALGFVLASVGDKEEAKRVTAMQPKRENGFSLAELKTIADKNGLPMRGFRGRAESLKSLPLPLVIHYDFENLGDHLPSQIASSLAVPSVPVAAASKSEKGAKAKGKAPFELDHRTGHFLVVQSVDDAARRVGLFDPQTQRHYALSFEQLDREWSGTGLVRVVPPAKIAQNVTTDAAPTRIAWLAPDEMKQSIGGCCGIALPENNTGAPTPPVQQPPTCGSPGWTINPISLNMYVSDTPLWYRSSLGPSVAITMSYNSQASSNQNDVFGNKWAFNYGSYLVEDTAAGGGVVSIFQPDGSVVNFIPNGQGGYTNPNGNFSTLRKLSRTRYEMKSQSGEIAIYDVPEGTNSLQAYLVAQVDRWGNGLAFGYDSNVHLTTITDALGRVTRLTYGDGKHITRVDDPFDRFITFDYDAWGNMVQVVDMEGNAFQYTYDSDIYITQLNTAQGAWQFTNQLPYRDFAGAAFDQYYYVTITNPLGESEIYGYDGHYSNITWMQDAEGRRTTYNTVLLPDGKGRVVGVNYRSADYQRSLTQTSTVDPLTGQTLTSTDPSGATTSFTYNGQGQIATVTDGRNLTSRFTYAANGIDLIGAFDATGKRVGTATYNNRHQPLTMTDARGEGAAMTYTAWGAPATVTATDGSVVSLAYDTNANSPARGQVIGVSKTNGTSGSVPLAAYSYDEIGRVETETGADGKTLAYEYDGLNRVNKVTFPDDTTTEAEYACCGGIAVEKARDGKKTYRDYDALKRPKRVQDTQGNSVQYNYDLTGNLKNLTDSKGNITSWQYDGLNRLDAKRMPDGTVERYGYDVVNRVLSRLDAQGRVTKSFFDPNGNLTRLDRPGSANDVTISYDNLDRPFKMTDNLGVTTYGFDNLDRITSIDGPWANDTQTYGYDNMGRRSWSRINGGDEVDYDYDALGRMKSIAGISGTFTANYAGNTSRLSELQLPNGAKTQYGYDGLNRLTQIQNLTGTLAKISSYAYGYGDTDGLPGYDNTSRRTFVDAQVGTQPLQRTLFHYDDVGQLQSEVEGNGAKLNRTYAYDAMGNRQSQTKNEPGTTSAAAVNTSFTRNPLNQITASTSTFSDAATPASSQLNYDASGNLTRVLGLSGTGTAATPTGATEYAYNDEDKLEEITQKNSSGVITGKSVFVYDGLGRKRISREFTYNAATQTYTKTEEIRRIYDGMDVVQERDENNVVKTNYVRSGNIGGLLSKSKREAGQQDVHLYYHYDGQGNVVQLTNATQMTVATYAYDAWGNSREMSGVEAAGNRYRFSTKEAVGGLYDYGLRFYSPGLGRWINRDPIAEEGGLNIYGFVGNNPVSNFDEYGLDWLDDTANFSAGWGDTLSFGTTKIARRYLGEGLGIGDANDVTDYDSILYHGGEVVGTIHSVAYSGAAAAAARRAPAIGATRAHAAFPRGIERVDRSHWIPNRIFQRFGIGRIGWMRWNLKNMWAREHARIDPMRHQFLRRAWKAQWPLHNKFRRFVYLTPDWVFGALGTAGAAFGTHNLLNENSNCD